MKKILTMCIAFIALTVFSATALAESHKATVAECIEMCKLAAEMILDNQEAALAEISKRDGRFVWKDSYVFAMDLTGRMLAHPMQPGLMKMDSFPYRIKIRSNPKCCSLNLWFSLPQKRKVGSSICGLNRDQLNLPSKKPISIGFPEQRFLPVREYIDKTLYTLLKGAMNLLLSIVDEEKSKREPPLRGSFWCTLFLQARGKVHDFHPSSFERRAIIGGLSG